MINNSIYDVSSQYLALIEHEHQAQAEMKRYMNEAVCLCEGLNIIDNMQIIQEGLYEDIKDKINKVAAFIKKMWLKFLEVMNRLARTNKSYLTNYKDTILKNKFKEDTSYNSYDWKTGYTRIMNDIVIVYDDEKKLVANMKSTDDFISHNYPEICKGYKAPYDFSEMCKSYFRGGDDQIELNAADLNSMIRSMYDYCLTYDEKLKASLEKEYNSFTNQAATLMDKFIKAQREAEKSGNAETQNESSIWDEESVYSSIYEAYITEDNNGTNQTQWKVGPSTNTQNNNVKTGLNKGGQTTPPTPPTTNNKKSEEPPKGSGATVSNNNDQNKSGSDNSNSNDNSNQKVSDKNASLKNTDVNGNGQSAEEIKALGNAVSEYVNIRNTYLTCRMSAAEAMYKDYMIIIRDHVSNSLGNTSKATKTVGTTNTNSTQTTSTEVDSETQAAISKLEKEGFVKMGESSDENGKKIFLNNKQTGEWREIKVNSKSGSSAGNSNDNEFANAKQ